MNTFTAVYVDSHIELGQYVDVLAATVAAAGRVPLPAPTRRGEHFDTSWWLAEDGTGRVRVNRWATGMRGSTIHGGTVAVYTVDQVRAEGAFSIEPPRRATDRTPCAGGSVWTDGTARLVLIPSGELLTLTAREWLACLDGALENGFRVRKLELVS